MAGNRLNAYIKKTFGNSVYEKLMNGDLEIVVNNKIVPSQYIARVRVTESSSVHIIKAREGFGALFGDEWMPKSYECAVKILFE